MPLMHKEPKRKQENFTQVFASKKISPMVSIPTFEILNYPHQVISYIFTIMKIKHRWIQTAIFKRLLRGL